MLFNSIWEIFIDKEPLPKFSKKGQKESYAKSAANHNEIFEAGGPLNFPIKCSTHNLYDILSKTNLLENVHQLMVDGQLFLYGTASFNGKTFKQIRSLDLFSYFIMNLENNELIPILHQFKGTIDDYFNDPDSSVWGRIQIDLEFDTYHDKVIECIKIEKDYLQDDYDGFSESLALKWIDKYPKDRNLLRSILTRENVIEYCKKFPKARPFFLKDIDNYLPYFQERIKWMETFNDDKDDILKSSKGNIQVIIGYARLFGITTDLKDMIDKKHVALWNKEMNDNQPDPFFIKKFSKVKVKNKKQAKMLVELTYAGSTIQRNLIRRFRTFVLLVNFLDRDELKEYTKVFQEFFSESIGFAAAPSVLVQLYKEEDFSIDPKRRRAFIELMLNVVDGLPKAKLRSFIKGYRGIPVDNKDKNIFGCEYLLDVSKYKNIKRMIMELKLKGE